MECWCYSSVRQTYSQLGLSGCGGVLQISSFQFYTITIKHVKFTTSNLHELVSHIIEKQSMPTYWTLSPRAFLFLHELEVPDIFAPCNFHVFENLHI